MTLCTCSFCDFSCFNTLISAVVGFISNLPTLLPGVSALFSREYWSQFCGDSCCTQWLPPTPLTPEPNLPPEEPPVGIEGVGDSLMSFIDGIPKEVKVLGGIVVGAFVAYGIYRLVAHKKSPKGGGGEV